MYIRNEDTIELSKIARYEPRRTGRTIRMISSIPSRDDYDGKIYVVGIKQDHANELKKLVLKIHGEEVASRTTAISSRLAYLLLRGVDPHGVFIDHAALEYGNVKDIKYLYSILDSQNSWYM